MKISGVKGMNDLLPGVVGRWQEMERVAREVFALYGYREVRTPAVEPAALFARGVGEATDIVKKEMYVFEDKGEERLALRPEATAGLVRAYIEHGCHVDGVQKWFLMGPMFRRERPQKGRYRQFHQIDCECFGVAEPGIDVEQIAMLHDYLGRLGVKAELKLNTVGDGQCRPAYLADLKAWLTERKGQLCADCNERIERNPLRVLDCKVESCQPVLAQAPRLLDRLCDGCRDHFAAVRSGLDALGVEYRLDPRLVRGLDYYVRTAYEFSSDALGSQSAVAGGGRYDGLVETLGGQPTPGIGYALGQERLALILEAIGRPIPEARPQVFFVAADEAGAREAPVWAARLRKAGVPCELDPRGGKLARQFKQAERVRARYAVVLGGNEVASGQAKLKDLDTREETPVALAELASRLASR
ncbi:histidine--tRNA ligase [Anaeromyxobacter diazotrophicus]|uniref:Histidine--tRNA ligase n=1 Tax=Anaeromyxobacter diazotrophicus TaxID=2590199 RepID=A0A7I9VM43_9BACT|nr:histidine--tRNA ligase [Anaeromyxobacter diazotrophicus]GEJ57189.1 histidine--tRNA ligase [Anaeromyxobacter diazotrophicus]